MKHRGSYPHREARLIETMVTGRSVTRQLMDDRKAEINAPAPTLNRQQRRALKRYNQANK